MTTRQATDQLSDRALASATSSAGLISAGSLRRTRHGAPEKAWLATVAKPISSLRNASSRWAIRSEGGSDLSVVLTQKQCTRWPRSRNRMAPASPISQWPRRLRSSARPVWRWSSRASCVRRSPRKPCATGSACSWRSPLRRTTLAPRNACSSGTSQACAKLAMATGIASGCSAISTMPAAMNGIVQPTVQSVQSRPHRRRRSRSVVGRQGTAARSGRAALVKPGLAAGDRPSQDHEVGIQRQLAHLRGGAVAMIPDPDVALLELLAEGGGGVVEVGAGPGPLRKLGVAGCIHPQQARHALMLRLGGDLEPDPAVVGGEAPAVTERIDQEEAATPFLGRTAARELVLADAGARVRHFTAQSIAAGIERHLDRTARAVLHGVRDELRDDHLGAPAIIGADACLVDGLPYSRTRTRRSVRRGRQFQRD